MSAIKQKNLQERAGLSLTQVKLMKVVLQRIPKEVLQQTMKANHEYWETVGPMIGLSPNSARSAWSRAVCEGGPLYEVPPADLAAIGLVPTSVAAPPNAAAAAVAATDNGDNNNDDEGGKNDDKDGGNDDQNGDNDDKDGDDGGEI